MRIIIATGINDRFLGERKFLKQIKVEHRLWSYYDLIENHKPDVLRRFIKASQYPRYRKRGNYLRSLPPDLKQDMRKRNNWNVKLMLDSGAYSAWTRGIKIDIDRYMEFIHDNKRFIDSYVCLDFIAGAPGRLATTRESVTEDAYKQSGEIGIRNYEYMLSQGFSPIPVYHQPEDPEVLKEYVRLGATYVGISPEKTVATKKQQMLWLNRAFAEIVDPTTKQPTIKTHGFGVTTMEMMKNYPWFSVDSTTWAKQAAYGKIYIPRLFDHGWDYSHDPISVYVTNKERREREPNRFEKLPDPMKQHVLSYINYLDLDFDTVRSTATARRAMNLLYFLKMQEVQFKQRWDKPIPKFKV